ncbi:hypothetical protein, partial [Candidatus Magnetobacterium casense]
TECDEAEDVVKEFLTKKEDFCIINNMDILKKNYGIDLSDFADQRQTSAVQASEPEAGAEPGPGLYRAFPDVHQTDGFFFTVMTRQ